MLICGYFSGIWFDRWSSVCLWHLHHLPANQGLQAACASLHWWEPLIIFFVLHSKHNTIHFVICTTIFCLLLQMTGFKHSTVTRDSVKTTAEEPRGAIWADVGERADQRGRWTVKMNRLQFSECHSVGWQEIYFRAMLERWVVLSRPHLK